MQPRGAIKLTLAVVLRRFIGVVKFFPIAEGPAGLLKWFSYEIRTDDSFNSGVGHFARTSAGGWCAELSIG
jgi:hypothetical protein